MNGGYILIDCAGLDLIKGQTEQSLPGLYARVKAAMAVNKPLVAVNANWGGLDVTPIAVFAIQLYADVIYVTASTLQVVIHDDDTVTINNMVGE